MSFIAPLIAGLSSLGGLFGNRQQTSQQSGTSQTNQTAGQSQTTSGTATQTPVLNPLAAGGYQDIINNYQKLLSGGTDLSGYQAGQTGVINRQAGIQGQNELESMAARGITSGPAPATALNSVEAQRTAGITGLEQNIPLLSRSLTQDTLQQYLAAIKSLPVGTTGTTTGMGSTDTTSNQTTNQSGSVTAPGNMLGGLFGSLGTTLAGLYGQGAFNKPQTQGFSY